MMLRFTRGLAWAAFGVLVVGCASNDVATADPEAQMLAPPVVIVDDPPPEPEQVEQAEQAEGEPGVSPAMLVKNPDTEVITFSGEDADPGMTDEVAGSPPRKPLPSMMSDIITGPNK